MMIKKINGMWILKIKKRYICHQSLVKVVRSAGYLIKKGEDNEI